MSPVNTETSDRYERCDICGCVIDTFGAGYFKSHDDETFRHRICHEEGEPPEDYAWRWGRRRLNKVCHNYQFNCGHSVYCPSNERPQFCPECNPIEYVDGNWQHENATAETGGAEDE